MFTAPASSTRPAAGAKPAQHPTVEKYGGLIGNFIKQNYDRAMYFVAYSEVAILLWTILRAVTFRGSFTTPLIVSQWLRVRYLSSNFERKVVDALVARLDHLASQQSPTINNVYKQAKGLVSMWGSAVSTPAGPTTRSTGNATGVNAGAANTAGMRERTAPAARR